MRYGTERLTTTLDDNGSTLTTETNIREFKAVKPIRKHFAIREKVRDKKEQMIEYMKWADSVDDTKLDPEFKIERTKQGNEKGFWYVVKCWTELVYS